MKSYTFKFEDGPQTISFEIPSVELYDRFENERRQDEAAARTRLVKACVKSHTGVQLDAIFSRYPAVKHALALAILKESGGYLEMIEGEALPS